MVRRRYRFAGETTNSVFSFRLQAAQWTTFRFSFPSNNRTTKDFNRLIQRLSHLADDDTFRPIVSVTSLPEPPTSWSAVPSFALSENLIKPFPPPTKSELSKQPFSIRYLIEGLIGRGLIKISDVTRLLALAKEYSDGTQDRVEKLLGDLYLVERIVSLKKTVART